jgi:2-polyprenyl-3-methyl-5-hydroxy-6-metoxy-1,4-benzoquinol methylase
MFGVPFEQKVEEQKALLREAGVKEPGVTLDLGCGSGFQAVALANLGATRVHAMDTSAALLRELKEHAQGGSVTTHEADLMLFDAVVATAMDTIVCMGDTLTHLATKSDVAALLDKVAYALRDGGRLVLSWRDLSNPTARLDRFIPIRSTDDRKMVCFLEDQGETVLVHDLIWVRTGEGDWQLQKHAYPKLKLSPEWLRVALTKAGLAPVYERTVQGMTVLAATA